MDGTTSLTVGICTYRRYSIVDTLASLAAQGLPGEMNLRVVVADNDAEPEARERVERAAAATGLTVRYIHAPSRNICIARNACLDAAEGAWIAFLDDDETAAPGWLAALLAEAERSGADAVLGPVEAIFAPDAPGWVREADLHSTRPVFQGGRIVKGYAGNVLIRRETIERLGLRFDLALGRTGGEDDDFFYRLTDAGGVIAYAPQAVAYEPAASERTRLRWLIRRSFRTGQTHGARLASRSRGFARGMQVALAAVKGGACLACAAVNAVSDMRRNRWLVRGALHAGAAARLCGVRVLELY